MFDPPIRMDQTAAGMGVGTAIRQPELIEHQFGAVVKLDREPVPAYLRFRQLALPNS